MSSTAITFLALGLFLVGVVAIVLSMRRLRRGQLSTPLALGLAIILIAAVSVAFAVFATNPSYDPTKDAAMPAREAHLYSEGFNLLPDAANGNAYVVGAAAATMLIRDGKQYISPPIFTRGGEQFHFTYSASGSGILTASCTWENEAHIEQGFGGLRQDVLTRTPLTTSSQMTYAVCLAPNDPDVANLRVTLSVAGGNASVTNLRLASDNIRVEQWPAGYDAALAFSFDWESAMGGPIHSRGMTQHDVQFAVTQGNEMRQGADNLALIFAQNSISATFYATGYDLLDGTSKSTSQDITYTWASAKNGWPTDYWTQHGWYSDDPFSSDSDPVGKAWYFGDQADRLHAAGHEIATHTFGHLYVRGTTSAELDADLTRWYQAAAARNLPPATTFAFPWRSSNSVDLPFYDVMRQHGIVSVTRLYEKDLHFPLTFSVALHSFADNANGNGGMLVVPDFLLGAGSAEEQASIASGEGTGLNVVSVNQAKQVIDADVALAGVTSFWNHPLAVIDPTSQQLWSQVAAYAASQRSAGRLWIAPVGNIVARHNAMREVQVIPFPQGDPTNPRILIADVHNPTAQPIADVTISVDGAIVAAVLGGKQASATPPLWQRGRLVIGTLAPGATIRVAVTVQQ